MGGRETGLASVLGLALVLLVMLLGMGLWRLVQGGLQDSDEYLLEMQLRLAAESGLEKAAVRIEKSGGTPVAGLESLDLPEAVGQSCPLLYQEKYVPAQGETIDVQVFLVELKDGTAEGLADGERPERLAVLEAWAALPQDIWGWQRRKVVRGQLVRPVSMEGERAAYVWRGWLPA